MKSENDNSQAPNRSKDITRGILGRVLWVLAMLVVVASGLYLIFSTEMVFKSTLLEEEKIKLEAEIEALTNENYILRQKLERLQTDPGYVEDQARKKLGLIRPNEIIFRLAEEPDLGPSKSLPQPKPEL